MMSKFIFENKEEYNLYQLESFNAELVVCAYARNYSLLQVLSGGSWESVDGNYKLDRKHVYRVLAKPKSPLDIALKSIEALGLLSGDESCVISIVKELSKSLGGES